MWNHVKRCWENVTRQKMTEERENDQLTLAEGMEDVSRALGAKGDSESLVQSQERLGKKAWWWDLTGLVGEKDQQLAVIKPRSDVKAKDFRELGQTLELWKTEFAEARHIWGLDDLLEGREPRTPPIYLMVPFIFHEHEFGECFEPVALVYVAETTNFEAAMTDLSERLTDFNDRLAWFGGPDAYSDFQR